MHTCENNTSSPPPFITMMQGRLLKLFECSYCLIKIEDGLVRGGGKDLVNGEGCREKLE